MSRPNRVAASVTALLKHQSAYGSFVASPDSGQYQFCWLRDSAFISRALDAAGEQAAAARYHRWVAGALAPLRPAMADAAALADRPGASRRLPPARFALDGSTVRDDWPNFQIDGYGAWIWSLREHLRLGGDRGLLDEIRAIVDATWRYLDVMALHPCFDVWEEHGDRVHTSTLACVQAGVSAAADLLDEPRAAVRAAEVESYLLALAARYGRFPKSASDGRVDGSTLWLCGPLGIVAQPAMAATVDAIKAELKLDGGIRRYLGDTFFGGGAWPVLTASLGLYWLAAGDGQAAGECLAWIEAKFDAEGRLGEQFGGEHVNPAMYREWVVRWGHPARDLLWSHAMYILLALAAGLSPDAAQIPEGSTSDTAFPRALALRSNRPGLAACAIGCAALALTACSSSSSSSSSESSASSSSAAKTVTLQFWSAYNTTDAEASTMANVVIPQFERENPGIKVDSVVYPYADLLQKFLAAAAAGDPPNIMRSDIIWVPQLASQGVLLPLGNLPWYSPIAASALPGPLATTKWKGQAYALPLDTNTQALFWNKADFKAAGLSGPPTTLAQLYADAAKLTIKSKQQFGLGVDGTDIWNVAPYIWSNGGGFTTATYTSATGVMSDSSTMAEVTALDNLLKAGNIGSDFRGGSGAVSGETGFPKGEYAMYLDGPWAVPTYTALQPPPDYGIAPVPSGAAGSISTVGGEDLVIPKNAANLAATEKFAQFLDSQFAQLAMAKVGQMSAIAAFGPQEVAATPYYSIFVQQLKTAEARPVSPGYTKLDTDFSNELAMIIDGKVSVSAGLSAAAQQSNTALSGS